MIKKEQFELRDSCDFLQFAKSADRMMTKISYVSCFHSKGVLKQFLAVVTIHPTAKDVTDVQYYSKICMKHHQHLVDM